MVAVHMKSVILTPLLAQRHSDGQLLMEVLLECVICLLAESSLLLLLVTDPGFIEEPTDLSCRCANCQVEVEDFDHHCGVLGACIGKGNMCYFILFLLFASLLCFIGGAVNAAYIVQLIAEAPCQQGVCSWMSLKVMRSVVRSLFGSFRHLCLLLLTVAAVYGGAVCIFLCLRYTYLAYSGRSSVRRRRRETLRGSLSLVFANVFRPKFAHNYRFATLYASEEMLTDVD